MGDQFKIGRFESNRTVYLSIEDPLMSYKAIQNSIKLGGKNIIMAARFGYGRIVYFKLTLSIFSFQTLALNLTSAC